MTTSPVTLCPGSYKPAKHGGRCSESTCVAVDLTVNDGRDMAPHVRAARDGAGCKCGVVYATAAEFKGRPLVGFIGTQRHKSRQMVVELRECECGETIGREIVVPILSP